MGSRWAYSPWPYVFPLSGRVRTWPFECKVQGRVSSCLGLKVGTLREEEESDDARFMCMCVHTEPCPTLCDPMDCSPPGSLSMGLSQARILGWVAISSSRRSSWPRGQTCISCIGRWNLCHCAAWEVWSFCNCGQIWEGNISCAGLFLWPPTTSGSSTIYSINQAGSVLWL